MKRLSVLTILSLGICLRTCADERFFGYVYESEVLPKGKWEYEQWLTLREGYPDGDRNFNQYIWDFRSEIEYGVTEQFSISGYLNFQDNQYVARTEGFQNTSEFQFEGVSAEFKYQLLSPTKDPVGVLLYFEPLYGAEEQELEYKLVLSKNLGDRWVIAANATYEQDWEHEDGTTVREAGLDFSVGVSYRLTPNWAVGVEGRCNSVYSGFGLNEHLGTGWFVGPNVHYGSSRWWATLTVLPQVAGNPSDGGINRTEHQTFETRLIFGINF